MQRPQRTTIRYALPMFLDWSKMVSICGGGTRLSFIPIFDKLTGKSWSGLRELRERLSFKKHHKGIFLLIVTTGCFVGVYNTHDDRMIFDISISLCYVPGDKKKKWMTCVQRIEWTKVISMNKPCSKSLSLCCCFFFAQSMVNVMETD